MATKEVRISEPISARQEVRALRSRIILDPLNGPCMECNTPGKPKPVVLGLRSGLEVRRRGTDEVVGYVHTNCKEVWVNKNGETEFAFRTV